MATQSTTLHFKIYFIFKQFGFQKKQKEHSLIAVVPTMSPIFNRLRLAHSLQAMKQYEYAVINCSPFYPWCTHYTGLDKCVLKGTCHYCIIQSSFTLLKSPVLCVPIPPPLPQLLAIVIIFLLCLHNFAFSRTSQGWNHTVSRLFRLASLTWRCACKVPPCPFMADGQDL